MLELYVRILTPLDVIFAFLGLILVTITIVPVERFLRLRRIEDSRVNKLCISAAVFCFWSILHKGLMFFSAQLINTGIVNAAFYIKDMFYQFYTLMWLMFVEAILYRSADNLKRKYRYSFIPFILLIAHIIYVFISFQIRDPDILAYSNSTQFIVDRVTGLAATLLTSVLGMAYMIHAYRLMNCYMEEIRQPVFFRLDVFFIPWAVGNLFFLTMMIPNFPRLPDISPLCAGLSLFLTYQSMKKGFHYMDQETRFYKKELLDQLPKIMEKNRLDANCAVIIKSLGWRELVSKVIFEVKPERSSVFDLKDGGFMLLSDVQNESAVKLLIQTIRDCVKELNSEVEIEDEIIFRNEKESLGDFILRLQRR